MTSRIKNLIGSPLVLIVMVSLALITGCGEKKKAGPTFESIPQYPNSVKKESMSQSSFMGAVKGKLEQFSTEDSFEDVLNFYKKSLQGLKPIIQSHELPEGKQAAIVVEQKNGAITVAIQEFKDEKKVMITVMRLGK